MLLWINWPSLGSGRPHSLSGKACESSLAATRFQALCGMLGCSVSLCPPPRPILPLSLQTLPPAMLPHVDWESCSVGERRLARERQRELKTRDAERVLLPGLPLVLQVFIPGFPERCYNHMMPFFFFLKELAKFAFYLLSPKEF